MPRNEGVACEGVHARFVADPIEVVDVERERRDRIVTQFVAEQAEELLGGWTGVSVLARIEFDEDMVRGAHELILRSRGGEESDRESKHCGSFSSVEFDARFTA